MPNRNSAESAMLTHKVLSPADTVGPISHWQGFEVPVFTPQEPSITIYTCPAEQLGIVIPLSSEDQEKQIGNLIRMRPESDLARVTNHIIEILPADLAEDPPKKIGIPVEDIIDDKVTREQVESVGKLRPTIYLEQDKKGEDVLIFQGVGRIAAMLD